MVLNVASPSGFRAAYKVNPIKTKRGFADVKASGLSSLLSWNDSEFGVVGAVCTSTIAIVGPSIQILNPKPWPFSGTLGSTIFLTVSASTIRGLSLHVM